MIKRGECRFDNQVYTIEAKDWESTDFTVLRFDIPVNEETQKQVLKQWLSSIPIRYTVVQETEELPIWITPREEYVKVNVGDTTLNIYKGQLFELGALFMTLAGTQDCDSVNELLDGYGYDFKKDLQPSLEELIKEIGE